MIDPIIIDSETDTFSPSEWGEVIFDWAKRKGWYDTDHLDTAPKINGRNSLEICALITSEISEALEEARHGKMQTYWETDKNGVPRPKGFFMELAGAFVRIADTFGAAADEYGEDFDLCVSREMEYNETRDTRHGGKLA